MVNTFFKKKTFFFYFINAPILPCTTGHSTYWYSFCCCSKCSLRDGSSHTGINSELSYAKSGFSLKCTSIILLPINSMFTIGQLMNSSSIFGKLRTLSNAEKSSTFAHLFHLTKVSSFLKPSTISFMSPHL